MMKLLLMMMMLLWRQTGADKDDCDLALWMLSARLEKWGKQGKEEEGAAAGEKVGPISEEVTLVAAAALAVGTAATAPVVGGAAAVCPRCVRRCCFETHPNARPVVPRPPCWFQTRLLELEKAYPPHSVLPPLPPLHLLLMLVLWWWRKEGRHEEGVRIL